MKISTGKITATQGIMAKFSTPEGTEKLAKILTQYENCKWGKTDRDDWVMNDVAVEEKRGRVVALYGIGQQEIFIITEYTPKPITTIMLTQEY
jgi:hypothetical protein